MSRVGKYPVPVPQGVQVTLQGRTLVAKGKLGEHYRFGWQEEAIISRDFSAPETAPDLPAWLDNMDRVLESMDDLSGIEEP